MSTPVKKVPIHLQSAQNRLLIKNGKIVNANESAESDVYIEDGVVKQLGRNLIIPGGTRIVDAKGKLVIPGGIDPHTHFELEFMGAKSVDDFYQGTKAAVAGGTTMIMDFVLPKKGESLVEAYHEWRRKAEDKVCCDYGLHVCITWWSESVKQEMKILCEQYGINSFKMFMAYDFMLNDTELYAAMETCRDLGAIAQVHAENGHIIKKNVEKLLAKGIRGPEGHELSRPEEVEAEAVNRACVIAQQVKAPLYVCGISCARACEQLNFNSHGEPPILGEVYAAALGCAGNPKSTLGITSPPLRSDPNTPLLLTQLLASNKLQVTGSDNCTFTKEQKQMGKGNFSMIPNGVNGVEDRMSVVWEKCVQSGLMDANQFVAVTSTNAAKIFNLFPRKGTITIGSDADIIIWNPSATRVISAKTHHQAVDFNIFEGMECHGVPELVIVGGRVCVDGEDVRVVQGHGRYVDMLPYPPFVYDKEAASKITDEARLAHLVLDDLQHSGRASSRASTIEDDEINKPTLPNSEVTTPSCRGPRAEGQRNLQDSTFSISEELNGGPEKACIRVRQPPGGKSSGGFW